MIKKYWHTQVQNTNIKIILLVVEEELYEWVKRGEKAKQ